MTQAAQSEASVPLDDPDFPLRIRQSCDYQGWRSNAAQKEPWTFDWLKTIGAGTLYDVGACVGSYSLMAAARGARVVAIEPVVENAAACSENARLNGLSTKITVLQCAAGSAHDFVDLFGKFIPGYGLASRVQRTPEQEVVVSVRVRTLDDITREHGAPTHIKIDVEGGEMDVIGGAERILPGVQSIICEITNDENEAWVVSSLKEYGLKSVWNGGRRTERERTHIFRRAA